MNKYGSEEEREAAIAAGETTRRQSSLQDGRKHYAVMQYSDGGTSWRVHRNLTGTEEDNLSDAVRLAQRWDHGPFADGVDGYAAERIA